MANEVPINIRIKNKSAQSVFIKGTFKVFLDEADKPEQSAYILGKELSANEEIVIADFFENNLRLLLQKHKILTIIFKPDKEMENWQFDIVIEKYFKL